MCLICDRIKMIRNGTNPYFVKELETGYVVIGDNQHFRGYTLFLYKHHGDKTELFHLDSMDDTLRRSRTIDWQKREGARARMRMMIRKLLKAHRYPPEGMDDAVATVMQQCELWADNMEI